MKEVKNKTCRVRLCVLRIHYFKLSILLVMYWYDYRKHSFKEFSHKKSWMILIFFKICINRVFKKSIQFQIPITFLYKTYVN